jgi:hypothetical protein
MIARLNTLAMAIVITVTSFAAAEETAKATFPQICPIVKATVKTNTLDAHTVLLPLRISQKLNLFADDADCGCNRAAEKTTVVAEHDADPQPTPANVQDRPIDLDETAVWQDARRLDYISRIA